MQEHAKFYECQYTVVYHGQEGVHDALGWTFSDSKDPAAVRGIVGGDVPPYGIGVTSPSSRAGKTWFRIRIGPKIEGMHKTYYCDAMYRDVSLGIVVRGGGNARGVIRRLPTMVQGRE